MNAFDDREKAFEAKYHLDEELAFKVNVRRDKLLGLWVAERLGLSGNQAQAYARAVVEQDFADPRHVHMLAKLNQDLAEAKVEIAAERLQREMERLLGVAKQEILAEVVAGKQSLSPE